MAPEALQAQMLVIPVRRPGDPSGLAWAQAVAGTEPLRILFINRHYREGRMILNQAELAHMIE